MSHKILQCLCTYSCLGHVRTISMAAHMRRYLWKFFPECPVILAQSSSANPSMCHRAWAKPGIHTTMRQWRGTSIPWRTSAPTSMNSARRRRCTRPWRNLLMPPTTMCIPIPTMGTGRHSKHGALHDAVPRFRAGGDGSSHPAGACPWQPPKGMLHSQDRRQMCKIVCSWVHRRR